MWDLSCLPSNLMSFHLWFWMGCRTEPVHNLGILLDSCSCLKSRWQSGAGGLLYNFVLYIKNLGGTVHSSTHALVTSWVDLLGIVLEDHPETATGPKCASVGSYGLTLVSHVTPLLCNPHWLPVCFQVEFKVLAVIYKTLHGMAQGYLWNCLSMVVSIHPTRSNRDGMLWLP